MGCFVSEAAFGERLYDGGGTGANYNLALHHAKTKGKRYFAWPICFRRTRLRFRRLGFERDDGPRWRMREAVSGHGRQGLQLHGQRVLRADA